MRIAIPVWQGRVSPAFDVATQVLIVDLDENNDEVNRHGESLTQVGVEQRCARLAQLGVERAICCAVSRPLEMLLEAHGIQVLSRICGDADEIVQALRNGLLQSGRFAMPGCCGGNRCRRRGVGTGYGRRTHRRSR